ncbi:uncharacterized protein KY384_007893 [Bacidia gigantensis]|uniref:uncharacterized protein n=1 Tax=Bacidia gigantensis TaxID=2732470 RepID=UPI001D03E743|nr:uncharacterized protein KY384_007893 [Bacidia gigantensis]KAG8527739.1 hypothetical protein KY384_007893 [Bacidia gigantensis]
MSYNGYSQYSPYYQQQQQISQQQPPYQQNPNSFPQDSRMSDSYSSAQYQPLSAYQSKTDHQKQQSQGYETGVNNHATGYSSQSSGHLGTSSGGTQGRLDAYVSSGPDTTALGNLAYASSLGQGQNQSQNQSSLSQLIDSNRARNTSKYGNSSPVPHNHQRGGSGGFQGHSDQQARQSQSSPVQYQVPHAQPSFSGQNNNVTNAGRSSPAQYQYSAPPQQQSSQTYRQYTPQVSRPASGQAIQRPTSGLGRQNAQSTPIPNNQAHQSSMQVKTGYHHGLPQSSTMQQSHQRPSSSISSANPATASPKPIDQAPKANSSARSARQTVESGKKNSKKPSKKQTQLSSGANGSATPQPPSIDDQHPTTVDPNQVFNHYEYQRRQEEAEAARKAKVQNASTAGSNPSMAVSPAVDDVTQAAQALMGQSTSKTDSTATKEQIELEMKQMIEKMRDYKAKDPGLFSQVWEEVKKGQPAQAPTSRTSQSGPAASPIVNAQTISPQQTDLPAESDLPAASIPAEFDRGRYPMLRRKRGNAFFTPDKASNSKRKSTGSSAQIIDLETSEPLRPNSSERRPQQSSLSQEVSASNVAQVLKAGTRSPSAAQAGRPLPVGKTHWPEHKKRALADAARQALIASPQNAGKGITTDEIHALLDGNPSYYQLCEHLEGKGFVIDRGSFARTLLTAIPDLSQNAQQTVNQPPGPIPTAIPPFPVPNGYVPSPASRTANSFQAPVANMQGSGPFGIVSPVPAASGQSPLSVEVKPEISSAAPQSKEEKAKKRNFGDIVDLSILSDEDEFIRHRPKPRVEQSKPALPSQNMLKEPTRPFSNQSLNQKWGLPAPELNQQRGVKPYNFQEQYTGPQRSKTQPSGKEDLLYEKVVEPMNRRRDALRRSNYDPRTICRDILLASGRHPTMPSLNSHLDGLSERFVSVDVNADLSTFRWDLVDPGGPAPPKPISQLAKHEDQDTGGKESSLRESAMSAPKMRPVVAVGQRNRPDFFSQPIGSGEVPVVRRRGRPPKQSGTKSHQFGEQQFTQGNHSTLAPIQMPSFSTTSRQSVGPIDTTTSPYFSAATASAHKPPSDQTSETTPFRVPGRKGRPPGAKNRNPRSDKGVSKRKSQAHELQQPLEPFITASLDQVKSEASTPTRLHGQQSEITPTSSRIAIVVPTRSPSISNPDSGRKNSIEQGKNGKRPSSPSYTVYKCHWERCPAELHNIEILHKHVRKQHRERLGKGPWACKWADCSVQLSSAHPNQVGEDDELAAVQRLMFDNEDAWDDHVEEKHLSPYAEDLNGFMEEEQAMNNHKVDGESVTQGARTLAAKKKAIGGMGIYKTGVKVANDVKRRIMADGERDSEEGAEEVQEGTNSEN